MYRKSSESLIKHFDFLFLDLILVLLSLSVAYLFRNGTMYIFGIELYRNAAILLGLAHILIAFFTESYKGILRRGFWKEFLAVLKHCLYLTVFLLFYLFVTQNGEDFSRIILMLFPAVSLIIVYLGRISLKAVLKKTLRRRGGDRALLLVTSETIVDAVLKKMMENPFRPFRITGIVLLDQTEDRKEIQGIPVVANGDNMLEYIKCNWVDEVFVNLPREMQLSEELAAGCSEMGVTLHMNLPQIAVSGLGKQNVENLAGYTVLTYSMTAVSLKGMFCKRLLDIVGAVFGLIVTGLLFVIFAPIIYIQSPGPIFFSQERIGKNGKVFRIYKFRSMYLDAEERKKELMAQNKINGLMFKIDDDPRIIPIGKFMRAASLDEFPQFWNILKGEMSLVGTRPPTVDEYEQYELHHKARLAAKPGLTGLWQVSGRSDITDFEEVVSLDTQYIQNWNFGLDIKILLKTVFVVLKREGSV